MTTSFPSVVEAYETQRLATAKRDGFALFPVAAGANCPAFIYTVGMAQHGLPEMLVFCTEEMCNGTAVMLHQVASHLIEGTEHFQIPMLLKAFLQRGITVSDPTIHYQPEFLRADDLRYALQCYCTRVFRFREQLGTPKGVMVLNHEGVPSIRQIRAAEMLASS